MLRCGNLQIMKYHVMESWTVDLNNILLNFYEICNRSSGNIQMKPNTCYYQISSLVTILYDPGKRSKNSKFNR